MPLNLNLMATQGNADDILLVHHHVFDRGLAGCCMAWHQRVLLHMMFTGYVNGWVANSAFTGKPLERPEAVDDIVHRTILRLCCKLVEDITDYGESDWTSSDQSGEEMAEAHTSDPPVERIDANLEEPNAPAEACGLAEGSASAPAVEAGPSAAAPVQDAGPRHRRVPLQPGRASPPGENSQRNMFANAVERERPPERDPRCTCHESDSDME